MTEQHRPGKFVEGDAGGQIGTGGWGLRFGHTLLPLMLLDMCRQTWGAISLPHFRFRLHGHGSGTEPLATQESNMPHPALSPDQVAVVTGGASGIGLAAA